MNEKSPVENTNSGRQHIIVAQAESRYGTDALFVYARRQQKEFVAMTLAEAMAICGQHMADEDTDQLWRTLDKWQAMAAVLAEKSPSGFERARELGRNVLRERGLNIRGEGGATTER